MGRYSSGLWACRRCLDLEEVWAKFQDCCSLRSNAGMAAQQCGRDNVEEVALTSQMAPMMTLDAKAQTPTMVAKVASKIFLFCKAQQPDRLSSWDIDADAAVFSIQSMPDRQWSRLGCHTAGRGGRDR